MSKKHILIRELIGESLNDIGFALAHFPSYVDKTTSRAHGHDILEANYILSGTAIHSIDGEERICPPGSFGIVQPGQNHILKSKTSSINVINIYLDTARYSLPTVPEEFSEVVGQLFPPAGMPEMPRASVSFLHFKDPSPLASILLYCIDEQNRKQAGYKAAMESSLRIILIACARQAINDGIETMTPSNSKWKLIEKLRLLLEQDYPQPYSLSAMADYLGISEGHLCRQFKAYTGLTPVEYLVRRRIRAAMQNLRTTDNKILDIALTVGFNDIGYFNRKFRAIVGQSPREYRKGRSHE